MIVAPDESYSAAEAGELLGKSARQVLRYLTNGHLRGSNASGRWTVTALQIWQYQGIADEMMANWREYCRLSATDQETEQCQKVEECGE